MSTPKIPTTQFIRRLITSSRVYRIRCDNTLPKFKVMEVIWWERLKWGSGMNDGHLPMSVRMCISTNIFSAKSDYYCTNRLGVFRWQNDIVMLTLVSTFAEYRFSLWLCIQQKYNVVLTKYCSWYKIWIHEYLRFLYDTEHLDTWLDYWGHLTTVSR